MTTSLLSLDDLLGIQRALAMLGHDPGVLDGLEGPRTHDAITAFQTSAGLQVDGMYGPKTRAALHQAVAGVAPSAGARGTHRQIGDEKAWVDTRAAVGYSSRVYVSYASGKLFGIEPLAGRWTQIGTSEGWKTRLMFVLGRELALVEESGSLWLVHPGTGAYRQQGADGEWGQIVCGGAWHESIQCVSALGALWEFTTNGGWRQIGDLNTWKTRLLVPGDALVVLEESGEAFRIDAKSGAYKSLGHGIADATSATRVGAQIVARKGDGQLVTFDPSSGAVAPLSASAGWTAKAMVSTNGKDLVVLESNGTLFQVFV